MDTLFNPLRQMPRNPRPVLSPGNAFNLALGGMDGDDITRKPVSLRISLIHKHHHVATLKQVITETWQEIET